MESARFKVVESVGATRLVLLTTSDWVEAENMALVENWRNGNPRYVEGTHPTHQWVDGRCVACGGWDNGSYGSHAPCGYDWRGGSLVSALKRAAVASDRERQ